MLYEGSEISKVTKIEIIREVTRGWAAGDRRWEVVI